MLLHVLSISLLLLASFFWYLGQLSLLVLFLVIVPQFALVILVIGRLKDAQRQVLRQETFECYDRAAPSGRLTLSEDGLVLDLNSKVEEILGLSRNELLGKRIESCLPVAALLEQLRAQGPVASGQKLVEPSSLIRVKNSHAPERSVAVRVSAVEMQDRRRTLVWLRDVSEIHSEAEILAERLSFASSAAGVGIWEWVFESNQLVWNDTMFSLFEVEPNRFTENYEAWANTVHPDDLPDASEKLFQAIREEKNYDTVFRIVCPDKSLKYIKAFGSLRRTPDGRPFSMLGVNIDITEASVISERLNFASAAAGVGIWEWIVGTNQLLWNDTMYRLYGIRKDQFSGVYDAWVQSVHPEDLMFASEKLWTAVREEKPFDAVFRIVCPDQTVKYIKAFGSPRPGVDGSAMSILGVNIDVTEEINAKQQIVESAKRLEANNKFLDTIFENIPSVVVIKEAEGLTIYNINKAGEKLLGKPREHFIGKHDFDVYPPEEAEERVRRDRRIVASGELEVYEQLWQAGDMEPRWLSTKKVMVPGPDGSPGFLLAVSEDITEARKALIERTEHVAALEEKTRAVQSALREKEVLLKEIHHRVKNNLQVISSLLKLQSKYVEDSGLRALFRQSEARVHSMALIHERLYGAPGLAEIDLRSYIEELSETLVTSYTVNSRGVVSVKTDLQAVTLGIVQAVPCGLLLNEFISNALKHAFDPELGGELTIALKEKDDQISLAIADNGKGLPNDFDMSKRKSLGFEIIYTLTSQLSGTLKIERERGTRFTLEFQREKNDPTLAP